MRPSIEWFQNRVIMIDQRKLPAEEVFVECRDYEEVAEAIEKMIIRGAPAIGVAAAFGAALGVLNIKKDDNLDNRFSRVCQRLKRTRPTAINLFWALERMRKTYEKNKDLPLAELQKKLVNEALAIEREDVETNRMIGRWGKGLIKDGDSILTHCNPGELATAGYGTALGVLRAAFEEGKKIKVYVDETRPFFQGARLTSWELSRLRIPHVLIADNMAGWLMQKGEIDLAITGADRIARNGDAANKIGTYSIAVLAKENGLAFYIAAPLKTVDFSLADGSQIPIEERPPQEIREIDGRLITLPHVEVRNPAFDVTPARYISAIITERGIIHPPYDKNLAALSETDL